MKYKILFFLLISSFFFAQTGGINIQVVDEFSKKPIEAEVNIVSTKDKFSGFGNVMIENLVAKNYSFEISSAGYDKALLNDISIVPNQTISYTVGLNKSSIKIEEVVLTKKVYKTTAESPVSLRNITSEEVQKNAGSNRDISKAILSFPGVGSTATFRNDLFIRGGSSAENKFYVDGIEVPIINHFQTQGASGGPRGLITIDFIKDVDFYSGAFPAKRNGMLSSLFEFNFKQARKEKLGYKVVLGLDDMQLMVDGPLSKDQSWSGLFSVRKSNLQLLFKAIGLPFLPSYYDTNMRVSKKFTSGNELYFIMLGAIDQFKFNDKAKNTLGNQTLIERLPVSPQWNYTIGAGYRHLAENGNWLFTVSRNMLDNQATKYYKNIEQPNNLIYRYHSQESENKMRIDRNLVLGDFPTSFGGNINFGKYFNNSLTNTVTQQGTATDNYEARLNVVQYGFYIQTSKKFFNNQLNISSGVRVDGSNYNDKTQNIFQQFSPRLSLNYKLNPEWGINFNTGIYYQLPPYTALGFMNNNVLVNKNSLQYLKNSQLVGGVEYNGKNNLRITVETYYKIYENYPFSLRNQISLANLGGGFGVIGNEPLDSRGKGKTYGIEFLAQKRTINDFYGILAYTYGFSKFSDGVGNELPSSWDSRHILTLSAGKYFKQNWNIGARFRMQSGLPQTPYDLQRSALVQVWNVANGPINNFALLNSERGNLVHQLDVRAEKKWIFKKWQFTTYLDVVNVYGSKNPSNLPVVNLDRDANGNGIIANPNAPQNQQYYQLITDKSAKLTTLPYFGFIFEF